jgi:hypothetical protein
LGYEITRDYTRSTISIRMSKKIEEMYVKFGKQFNRRVDIPMPCDGYILKEEEFEELSED